MIICFFFGNCWGLDFFVCRATIGACSIGSDTGAVTCVETVGVAGVFESLDFAVLDFELGVATGSVVFVPLPGPAGCEEGIVGVEEAADSFPCFLPLFSALADASSTRGDGSVDGPDFAMVAVARGGKVGFFGSTLTTFAEEVAFRVTGGAGGGLGMTGGWLGVGRVVVSVAAVGSAGNSSLLPDDMGCT